MSEVGACVRCGRALKDLTSVDAGMGPVCRAKAAKSDSGRLLEDQPVLNDVAPLAEVGLVCRRMKDGRLACNVPHVVKYHSPDGFECGYVGSGPAELALNVLFFVLPHRCSTEKPVVSADAWNLHQEFKEQFIATMDGNGGRVPIEKINEWLAQRLMRAAA